LFAKQQRVPQRPKQNKNTRGIPKGQYNQRGKFFAFFLTCLRKKVAKKPLGFSENKKELTKEIMLN
jgi:hypothetical protein